ncbi:DUF5994 family protein [Streptomyces netropsis]|uniref:Uncharacterized protein n=1 Tax=Streptomyces netropsis TaxID=55404 RepID=A0A7W7LIG9_STRNE|nr:DUF5994 family protein [Streptomyces netropsis]MBB4890772.1 hypothetical protein [Streptomyces netropsis]GGR51825.1 hypothetical protein GCM10010219_66160 [Streptomyces netropsis]
MTGTMSEPTVAPQQASLPARLALAEPDTGLRRTDGAWWPRSHDLGDELTALLVALDARWGSITRITVDGGMWPVSPRRMTLVGRVVHLSRCGTAAGRHRICLLSYGIGRCDLLVVPPESPPDEARRLMDEAHDMPSSLGIPG